MVRLVGLVTAFLGFPFFQILLLSILLLRCRKKVGKQNSSAVIVILVGVARKTMICAISSFCSIRVLNLRSVIATWRVHTN